MPTPPKDPTARVVAEVLAGRHDGRFKEIAEAIQRRQAEGHTRFIWRITLGDDVWDALSVTAGEVRYVEQVTRIPWKKLNPADSMNELVSFVIAHYKAQGMDLEEAIAKAEEITQEQAEGMVDDYELVNPPKASTNSSDSTTT